MTPLQIVAMGVSGSGKSAVGQPLSERLGYGFIEGDSLHPKQNIEKMSSGVPLDDDDRRPWLERLAGLLAANRESSEGTVLACSALKRSYRDILRGNAGLGSAFFLHLDLPFDVLRTRMETREHFMPASLLQSQFDTLERLEPDETGFVLDIDAPIPAVIDAAVKAVESVRPPA